MNDLPRVPIDDELLVMLFMTRRCNLDCSYCHMDHDDHPDNELSRLTGFVDQSLEAYDQVLLHLFGGEPLMRPDLVRGVLEHVRDQHAGRNVKKLITSNGILLQGKNLELLLEHEVSLMLSLDGTFQSQGHMRVAHANNARAFEVILDNIRGLIDAELPFFVNMCVSPENVDRMLDNATFLAELGIPRIQIAYELGAHWTAPLQERFLDQFAQCLDSLHPKAVHIQNNPSSEPVLGSSLAILDANGDIYRGCAIVLENNNPTFDDGARVCRYDVLEHLRGFVMPRIDVVRHFMTHTSDPGDWARIRSNMHLGYRMKHLMERRGHGC